MFSGDFKLEINYVISIQLLYFIEILFLNNFVMGRYFQVCVELLLKVIH